MRERHTYELSKGGMLYPARLSRRLPWAPRDLVVSGSPLDLAAPGIAVVDGGDAAVGSAAVPLAVGSLCARVGATLYAAVGDLSALAAARACEEAGGKVVVVAGPHRSFSAAEEVGDPSTTLVTWRSTVRLARSADPETLVSTALAGTVVCAGNELPVVCAGTRSIVGVRNLDAVEAAAAEAARAARERDVALRDSFQASLALERSRSDGEGRPIEAASGHLVSGRALVRSIPEARLWIERDDGSNVAWLVCQERRPGSASMRTETVLLSPACATDARELALAISSLPGGAAHRCVADAIEQPSPWKSMSREQLVAMRHAAAGASLGSVERGLAPAEREPERSALSR